MKIFTSRWWRTLTKNLPSPLESMFEEHDSVNHIFSSRERLSHCFGQWCSSTACLTSGSWVKQTCQGDTAATGTILKQASTKVGTCKFSPPSLSQPWCQKHQQEMYVTFHLRYHCPSSPYSCRESILLSTDNQLLIHLLEDAVNCI